MKPIIASVIIAIALIGGALMLGGTSSDQGIPAKNVTTQGDTQVVAITAKGGYSPRVSLAQAGVPTILALTTNGTFDCSLALTIPSVGFRKNLPSSGTEEVVIPPQKPGTKFQGVCAMGMYSFEVRFQ